VAVTVVDFIDVPDRTQAVRPTPRIHELDECGAAARGAPPFRS
jgi:hypothetical protein